MSNDLHTSFSALTAEEFDVYATDLLEAYPNALERQRLLAYMLQTLAQDRSSNDNDSLALRLRRQRRRAQQGLLEKLALVHSHDYNRASALFTEQVHTDAQIIALLTNNDAEVFVRDRTLTGDVLLSGNNIKYAGLGYTGSAVNGDLACTCVHTGRLIVSGTDVTIEGVHFKFAAEWTDDADEFPMISFTGGTNVALTLKNCIFECTGAHADSRFLHGEHSGGGTQRIEGCLIKGFRSWMLLDATSASGTPTVKLDSFTMHACKIENCMGSAAARGMSSDPNDTVSYTDNLVAFGANGQHASFWDCFEANNTKTVICTGNTVTGAVKTDNRGFMQAWSRSAIPWTITYKKNTIANFAACFRCACSATFYAPNGHDSDFLLKSTPAETTSVDLGGSYVYPYNDATKTYAPENGTTLFPEPSGEFSGLSNFAHA